jgi:hypothetical protein
MKIEIDMSDSVVIDAAKRAFHELFKQPDYGRDSGGAGYAILRDQVQEAIAGMDFTAQIQTAAKAILADVVNETVDAELRKVAKARVKGLSTAGELFKGPQ